MVETSSEDEFKGDEIKMKLDSADSDLILSAMVERLPAGYRIRSPSHNSGCHEAQMKNLKSEQQSLIEGNAFPCNICV